MIAPRRPLRLACTLPPRAAVAARAIQPAALRWRRVRVPSAVRAVPGRLASCIVHLQQHLHLHFGPVNLAGVAVIATRVAALAARNGGAGRPRVAASGQLRPAAAMSRPETMATRRPAARSPAWAATAAPARPPAPVHAGRAQLPYALAPSSIANARAPSAGSAAPSALPSPPGRGLSRAQAGRTGSEARAAVMSGPRPALRSPGRPQRPTVTAPPMRHAQPSPALLRASGARELGRPAPADLARRTPPARAEHSSFIAVPPPATIEWRRHAQGGTTAEPAQWISGQLASPVAHALTDNRAALPVALASAIAPAFAPLDNAAADRMADDVIRRVERRLRIERERRGL